MGARAAAVPAAALFITLVLAGCGGSSGPSPRAIAPPTSSSVRTLVPPGNVTRPSLAVGLTEFNAVLLRPPGSLRDAPSPFARRARELTALRPALYRLAVDWPALQPSADRPADLAHPETGCVRDKGPCAAYAGIRDRLAAIREQQRRAGGGWEVVVVITGSPDWAAQPAQGCEQDDAGVRARPPTRAALAQYKQLIAGIARLGARMGVALRWWSPWNEPNHPDFLSPQRPRCDADAPSRAADQYATIFRAARDELRTLGGDRRLVVGEAAGLLTRKPTSTTVPEFISELPRDVVCGSAVWAQHAYIGGTDPTGPALRALDRRGCERRHVVWVTETGAGGKRPGRTRADTPELQRAGCEALHARLLRWWREPRVTAAFQYTFREDDKFPVGLATTDLAGLYPAYREWLGWGGDRAPTAAPPAAHCDGPAAP